MKSLSIELKETIARRLELASPAEVLAIASQLCGADPAPIAAAAASPSTRFFSDHPDTVIDHSTGLMWSRDDIGANLNWKAAHRACADLRLGGFSDWRLPTVRELLTLVDYERHSPAIDKDAFPACKSSWYWTSTPLASSPGDFAWYVFFGYGGASYLHRDSRGLVRAVRARQ